MCSEDLSSGAGFEKPSAAMAEWELEGREWEHSERARAARPTFGWIFDLLSKKTRRLQGWDLSWPSWQRWRAHSGPCLREGLLKNLGDRVRWNGSRWERRLGRPWIRPRLLSETASHGLP